MISGRILPLHLLYWSLLVLYLVTWGNLSNESPVSFDDGAFYSMAYTHNAGLNFYDGIVDVKPPLLIYLTSLGFRLSPSISFIKWLSVSMFGVLILTVYLTLRSASERSDIACFGVTLVATNWSLRHYGVVELSQSYWQAMLCLFSLVAVFSALSIRQHTPKFNGSNRILACVLFFLGGSIWAIALYTKQQSIVVLPAVAVLTLYSWSYQTLKDRFYYLSIFGVGAAGSVCFLYYLLLGNSPLAESYKYIFLSNKATNANMAFNDFEWWVQKGSVLMLMLTASVRIPIIAFIGFEGQTLIAKLVRIGRGLMGRDFGSMTMERLSRNEAQATGKWRRCALVIAMSVWALSAVVFYFLHRAASTHYLLELTIALAVIIPLIVSACWRYSPLGVMSINIMILGAILLWHGVVTDPIGVAGRDKLKADLHVAEVIGKSTDKKDRILLFTNPVLYYLADRLPASRFPFFAVAWSTPLMMSEYRRATVDALAAESTKVVIVHDRILQEMPESLRTLVVEELSSRYRALAFESKDVMFGTTQIYVRIEPKATLSSSIMANGTWRTHTS